MTLLLSKFVNPIPHSYVVINYIREWSRDCKAIKPHFPVNAGNVKTLSELKKPLAAMQ